VNNEDSGGEAHFTITYIAGDVTSAMAITHFVH